MEAHRVHQEEWEKSLQELREQTDRETPPDYNVELYCPGCRQTWHLYVAGQLVNSQAARRMGEQLFGDCDCCRSLIVGYVIAAPRV